MLKSIRLVSLEISRTDVNVYEDMIEHLPESIFFDAYKNVNCTEERRGWVETLGLTKNITLQRSASFTKMVSSSVSLSANIAFPKVGGSVTGGVVRNVSLTEQRGWSESEQVTTNSSRSINMEVAPRQILYVKLQKTVYFVKVPFSVNVSYQGVVEATYIKVRGSGYSLVANPKVQCFLLSDLLAEDQRVFIVEGFLENSSAGELKVLYNQSAVDLSTDCTEIGNKLLKVNDKAEDDTLVDLRIDELMDSDTGDLIDNDEDSSHIDFDLTIEEFIGTTSVQTSDSIAQVSVRHSSFGPGLCEVETRSSLGTIISTLSPPFLWSEWQVLESHIGAISLSINTTVKCDTGVRSEVRYWK